MNASDVLAFAFVAVVAVTGYTALSRLERVGLRVGIGQLAMWFIVGLVALAPLAGVTDTRLQADVNGVTLGDRVLWTEHEAHCNTDDVYGVVVGSERADMPGGVVYRMQPTCAGVGVGPTLLLPLNHVVLMDGAT